MEQKTISLELKDDGDDKGTFSAIFATLNVKDKDGDITLPGAFKKDQEVIISAYNHSSIRGFTPGTAPVGRGSIEEKGENAILSGRFNLAIQAGRDAYEGIKFMGQLQEYSYGYEINEGGSELGTKDGEQVRYLKDLYVYEASPVYRGAGEGTRTLEVKGYTQEGQELLEALQDYAKRTKDRRSFRKENDRNLSKADQDRLVLFLDELSEIEEAIKGIIDRAETPEEELIGLNALKANYTSWMLED